jgi:hypothetical protein
MMKKKGKSCESGSTCDSKTAKIHSKNCNIATCKILQRESAIKSEICKELLEKKKLIGNCSLQKENELIKQFEIIDKEEPKKNNFVFNKDYITLDSFGFGMSNSCLQITYSSRDISEARHMYDSLSVLSGLLTPFSASTAVLDSALIDWDVRLRMIEQSTDSRMKREYVIFFFLIMMI